jgi:hypothetical protein
MSVAFDQAVVWKIHPAIGVARVGNSETEFFLGPETADRDGECVLSRHDAGDPANLRLPAIKRQAARFRVFAYDAAGICLGEVTATTARSIEWAVELANRKASAARIGPRPDGRRATPRNKDIRDAERRRLDITPRPRRIAGPDQRAVFDDGMFIDIPVCLGEICTDPDGRLIVLGGFGRAGTYDATKCIRDAADNDGWYDDVADGPVGAQITLPDGRIVSAVPAWVVVAPPDFAPEITGVATQWDVLFDRAVRRGMRPAPETPSFRHDVLPILNRIAALPWVSRCALSLFDPDCGTGSGGVAIGASLALLAQPGDTGREARERVLAAILAHGSPLPTEGRLANGNPSSPADPWLRATATQIGLLRQWAAGRFKPDWPVDTRDGVDGADARSWPEALDRAVLDACAGGILAADLDREECGLAFLPGDPFRLDPDRLDAGAVTRAMPCPWQAGFLEDAIGWPAALTPERVMTERTWHDLRALEAEIAVLSKDNGAAERTAVLRERRRTLWETRHDWTRDLPQAAPARAEALVREWPHLGFVASHDVRGEAFRCGGGACRVEVERSPYLGSMAEYFHRLVNIESNHDFAPKALELALAMLADAKFGADPKYAPFDYTPEAFDRRLEWIYADFVDTVMYQPVPWESGDIVWEAEIDRDADGDPVRAFRPFHVGRFSDRALAERFRQFAPLNLTDGAWLQNIATARPMDGVMGRLARIWLDEIGNGQPELNHSNVYETLLRSLNIYMPPVRSRAFSEQDFVPSAFESPVFQFSVGLFPDRFLPELLGMTLYVEWEATPTMYAIARMMAARHIDPQYYRMHAAIDNINVGHGAMAKEAIQLYLHDRLIEGGDACVQEHWRRIWRGYVAWATLGKGETEIVERMMLIDKKRVPLRSALLVASDIRAPFVAALRAAGDPVSLYLRGLLGPEARALLDAWTVDTPPGDALCEVLCADINKALRLGIYEAARFAAVRLSADSRELLRRDPRHGVELIDLGRSLLEDAYPGGIVRRPLYPDVKAYYADRMAGLIRRKATLALQSHRRIDWLMRAFQGPPEDLMRALRERGFIDIDHPERSRLFEQTEFSGPMFRVFTDAERTIIIDWIESLRADGAVARPEPAREADLPLARSARRGAADGHPMPDEASLLLASGAPEPPTPNRRHRIGIGAVH